MAEIGDELLSKWQAELDEADDNRLRYIASKYSREDDWHVIWLELLWKEVTRRGMEDLIAERARRQLGI